MIDFYVYYRARPDAARDEVLIAALGVLAHVARASGIQGRLSQRVDDATTWMETYSAVADELAAGFEATLMEAATESGLEALLDPGTTRLMVRFRPCTIPTPQSR